MAKTIQRFNRTGSTQNRPRHGRPKKLIAHAQHHIQRLCLGNRLMSAASIAAEFEGVGGSACQCSDHTPHTASNWSAWLSSQQEASSKGFTLSWCTRNHVLWSDETKINLFGSDGVKRVWRQPGEEYKEKCVLPTFKHGGESVMVWGCMSAEELQFIEGTMNANM